MKSNQIIGLEKAKVVAPFAGARIEIVKITVHRYLKLSLPSRERGLKSYNVGNNFYGSKSLPSRERGLKLCSTKRHEWHQQSLPSRERGLKCIDEAEKSKVDVSLPSRERGLKFELPDTDLWNL